MSVLIVSLPGDTHAVSTQWALGCKGMLAHLICWSDFPQKLKLSCRVGTGGVSELHLQDDRSIDLNEIRSLWNHRTLAPEPDPAIDPADHEPIRQSSETILRGMAAYIEQQAFAANPTRSKWYFDNKLTQLEVARTVGFVIPDTIISNNPEEISDFLERSGPSIVKPLRFMNWNTGNGRVDMFSTPIDSLSGIDPVTVAACPMIYQKRVRKVSEYRVVVFGAEILCFEILSQKNPDAANDWRMISYLNLQVRPASLPSDIEAKIRTLMKTCGLVYGSLDFAVTQEGEVIFFEVNETGQFLWLEELLPDVPLLDMFADFLISADPEFRYRPKGPRLRFSDWLSIGAEQIAADRARHIQTRIDKRYPDRIAS